MKTAEAAAEAAGGERRGDNTAKVIKRRQWDEVRVWFLFGSAVGAANPDLHAVVVTPLTAHPREDEAFLT